MICRRFALLALSAWLPSQQIYAESPAIIASPTDNDCLILTHDLSLHRILDRDLEFSVNFDQSSITAVQSSIVNANGDEIVRDELPVDAVQPRDSTASVDGEVVGTRWRAVTSEGERVATSPQGAFSVAAEQGAGRGWVQVGSERLATTEWNSIPGELQQYIEDNPSQRQTVLQNFRRVMARMTEEAQRNLNPHEDYSLSLRVSEEATGGVRIQFRTCAAVEPVSSQVIRGNSMVRISMAMDENGVPRATIRSPRVIDDWLVTLDLLTRSIEGTRYGLVVQAYVPSNPRPWQLEQARLVALALSSTLNNRMPNTFAYRLVGFVCCDEAVRFDGSNDQYRVEFMIYAQD